MNLTRELIKECPLGGYTMEKTLLISYHQAKFRICMNESDSVKLASQLMRDEFFGAHNDKVPHWSQVIRQSLRYVWMNVTLMLTSQLMRDELLFFWFFWVFFPAMWFSLGIIRFKEWYWHYVCWYLSLSWKKKQQKTKTNKTKMQKLHILRLQCVSLL